MAGRIPQSFIDDLVARADIIEVIDKRVRLKKAGREYKACCPFHDEKTPSFTVSPSKQFFHCFGCGEHGTALGFLMSYEHLSFPEAVEALAGEMGLEVPREAGGDDRPRGPELVPTLERAADFFRSRLRETPAAVDYLKQRGVTGETAREFQIGYAPERWDGLIEALGGAAGGVELLLKAGLVIERDGGGHYDRFRGRVMFPIRDHRGRVISFGGRILGDGEPKYLNGPETGVFHKGRELYGLYEARQANRELPRLLVVEGYMDVVSLAQAGVSYAVATLGTATTPEHLERIFRVTDEVVFCFDGDRAGRQAAWRALENALAVVRDGRQLRFLFLPEGQDPDSLVQAEGREAFEARLDQALPLSEYLIESLAAEVDLASVEGRARLVAQASPLLARISDLVYREMMLDLLARRSATDRDTLRRNLSSPSNAPRAGSARGSARPARTPVLAPGGETPVRRAIRMLLADPGAAEGLDFEEPLASLEIKGVALLLELLRTAAASPTLTSGALLERFRGRPEHEHLERLAGDTPEMASRDDYGVDRERLRGELAAAVLAIRDQSLGLRLAELDALITAGTASEDQIREAQDLARARSRRP